MSPGVTQKKHRKFPGFQVVFLIVLLIFILGASGYYFLHFIPGDIAYGREAEFEYVPPSDERLEKWVRAQPGVYIAYVQRRPLEKGYRVEVTFGMTRNGFGQPPLPDLDSAAAEFGYRNPDGPFRHF